jgi:amino acid transporter
MLVAEIKQKLGVVKASLPMLVVAALLGLGGFLAFTFGLVALVANMIGTALAWVWGALAVAVLYFIVGGIFGYLGYREITAEATKPLRTLEVLKQDQQWIKDETRSVA